MDVVEANMDKMPCHASNLFQQQKSTRPLKYPSFMDYKYEK